jgi:hypothetical protein
MTLTRIIAIVAVGAVVAGGVAYVRSGGTPQAEAVGTSGEEAPMTVSTSSMFITLENHAGMAVKDVKVSVVPRGRATIFSAAIVPRIETNAKRVLSLGEFRGRDGTPLNMSVHTPVSVTITGERVDGKAVEMEVPWK